MRQPDKSYGGNPPTGTHIDDVEYMHALKVPLKNPIEHRRVYARVDKESYSKAILVGDDYYPHPHIAEAREDNLEQHGWVYRNTVTGASKNWVGSYLIWYTQKGKALYILKQGKLRTDTSLRYRRYNGMPDPEGHSWTGKWIKDHVDDLPKKIEEMLKRG